MTCISCQERREAIARIAARVGTIVFGGKRVLATPEKDNGIAIFNPSLDGDPSSSISEPDHARPGRAVKKD
jgi:hypothetical protein